MAQCDRRRVMRRCAPQSRPALASTILFIVLCSIFISVVCDAAADASQRRPVGSPLMNISSSSAGTLMRRHRKGHHCIHDHIQHGLGNTSVQTHPQAYANSQLIPLFTSPSEFPIVYGGEKGGTEIARTLADTDTSAAHPAENDGLSGNTTGGGWAPLRITADTSHLHNPVKHCNEVGARRPDFQGNTIECTASDVLTEEKRRTLESLVIPLVIQRVQRLINVQPIQGNLLLPTGSVCGRDVRIPAEHQQHGVPHTDIVVYALAGVISPVSDGKAGGSGVSDTIAWAGYCSTDQHGRPIVARVNFAPRHIIWTSNAWDNEVYVRAAVHELFHALGFTEGLLSRQMVERAEVREKPARVMRAPAVVGAGRAHLNCPTLDGVELEDEGGRGTASTHWERRQYRGEIMSGISDGGAVSNLTLAFFAGLPFYTVNTRYAERMEWAANAGCDFVNQKCDASSSQMERYWCSDENDAAMCTYDRKGSGMCLTGLFQSLPEYFQYFSDDQRRGGTASLLDYCPVVVQFSNRDCTSPQGSIGFTERALGHYFGIHSRCVPSSLVVQLGYSTTDESPRCLMARCPDRGKRVEFKLGRTWIACPLDGSAGDVAVPFRSGFSGTLHCEPAYLVCTPELFYGGVEGNGEQQQRSSTAAAEVYDEVDVADASLAPAKCKNYGSASRKRSLKKHRDSLLDGDALKVAQRETAYWDAYVRPPNETITYYVDVTLLLEVSPNASIPTSSSIVRHSVGALLGAASNLLAQQTMLDIGAHGTTFTPMFAFAAMPQGILAFLQLAISVSLSDCPVDTNLPKAPAGGSTSDVALERAGSGPAAVPPQAMYRVAMDRARHIQLALTCSSEERNSAEEEASAPLLVSTTGGYTVETQNACVTFVRGTASSHPRLLDTRTTLSSSVYPFLTVSACVLIRFSGPSSSTMESDGAVSLFGLYLSKVLAGRTDEADPSDDGSTSTFAKSKRKLEDALARDTARQLALTANLVEVAVTGARSRDSLDALTHEWSETIEGDAIAVDFTATLFLPMDSASVLEGGVQRRKPKSKKKDRKNRTSSSAAFEETDYGLASCNDSAVMCDASATRKNEVSETQNGLASEAVYLVWAEQLKCVVKSSFVYNRSEYGNNTTTGDGETLCKVRIPCPVEYAQRKTGPFSSSEATLHEIIQDALSEGSSSSSSATEKLPDVELTGKSDTRSFSAETVNLRIPPTSITLSMVSFSLAKVEEEQQQQKQQQQQQADPITHCYATDSPQWLSKSLAEKRPIPRPLRRCQFFSFFPHSSYFASLRKCDPVIQAMLATVLASFISVCVVLFYAAMLVACSPQNRMRFRLRRGRVYTEDDVELPGTLRRTRRWQLYSARTFKQHHLHSVHRQRDAPSAYAIQTQY